MNGKWTIVLIFILSAVAAAAVLDAGATRKTLQTTVLETASRDLSGFGRVTIPVSIDDVSPEERSVRYVVRSKKLGTVETFRALLADTSSVIVLTPERDQGGIIIGFTATPTTLDTIERDTDALISIAIGETGEILIYQIFVGTGIPAP